MKRTMKRTRLAVLVGLALAGPAGAQIPVLDAGNLAQAVSQVQSLAQQLATMQEQLNTLQQSYETAVSVLETARAEFAQLQTMYQEMTGATAHAGMLDDAMNRLHNFLPQGLDLGTIATGLGGEVAALQQQREAFTAEELFGAGPQYAAAREVYEEEAETVYTYLALARESYDQLRQRRASLDSLRQAAATATTQKAALDLNNRIAAENALLANDIAQLQALQMTVDLELESTRHNAAGRNSRRLTAPEDVTFPE